MNKVSVITADKFTVEKINALHNGILDIFIDALETAIKIGQWLTEAKAIMKHGEFGPWIKDNLVFSERSAQRYMSLFENREKVLECDNISDAYKMLTDGKSDNVSDLDQEYDEPGEVPFNRDKKAEVEMNKICTEVWQEIGIGKMPGIESKQGGSSAAFYPSQFKVIFRWNSWNKMPLAGKRLIAIHELYHALGRDHDSSQMFCHAYDLLTIEFYRFIYGEDQPFLDAMAGIKQIAESVIKASKE